MPSLPNGPADLLSLLNRYLAANISYSQPAYFKDVPGSKPALMVPLDIASPSEMALQSWKAFPAALGEYAVILEDSTGQVIQRPIEASWPWRGIHDAASHISASIGSQLKDLRFTEGIYGVLIDEDPDPSYYLKMTPDSPAARTVGQLPRQLLAVSNSTPILLKIGSKIERNNIRLL